MGLGIFIFPCVRLRRRRRSWTRVSTLCRMTFMWLFTTAHQGGGGCWCSVVTFPFLLLFFSEFSAAFPSWPFPLLSFPFLFLLSFDVCVVESRWAPPLLLFLSFSFSLSLPFTLFSSSRSSSSSSSAARLNISMALINKSALESEKRKCRNP